MFLDIPFSLGSPEPSVRDRPGLIPASPPVLVAGACGSNVLKLCVDKESFLPPAVFIADADQEICAPGPPFFGVGIGIGIGVGARVEKLSHSKILHLRSHYTNYGYENENDSERDPGFGNSDGI